VGYSPWGHKESNTTTEPLADRLVATTNNVVLVSGVQESLLPNWQIRAS